MDVKLADVFELQMGKTPARNNASYWGGKNSWVSISDMGNSKYIADTKESITDLGVQKSGIRAVPKNTVIMSFKLSIGKTAITSKEMYTNEAIMAFIDKKVFEIDINYIYHLFSGLNWTAGTNKAVMGLTLNKATLSQKKIPIPSIQEQQYIALVLDKVTDLIDKRKQQLEKLDELVKSRFVEMFGDVILNNKNFDTIKGERLFKLSNGRAVPEKNRKSSGIPAYGGNGISWYTDDILCENDTLVVGRVGFQSGNVHLAKGPLWITDNAMYISDFYNHKCNLTFLCALMKHVDFTRYQDAGDLKKVTQKPFMQMEFIFPVLEQQNQFANFVERVDKSKAEVQKSLDKLELLKKALMQKYFG